MNVQTVTPEDSQKIAYWLGWVQGAPNTDLEGLWFDQNGDEVFWEPHDWLESCDGTEAMIEALNMKTGWTVYYFHEHESWGVLHVKGGECLFRDNSLNKGLQLYLKEILDQPLR